MIVPEGDTKAVPHTRVTTVAGTLDDRYALEQWACRMVALGVAGRRDLYAAVAACRPDDKDALNRLVDQAKEAAAASAGANLGTALHAFCERVDLGEEIQIPPPWDADVAAYRTTLAEAGIEVVPGMVERHVVLPSSQIAGKLDRLVTFGSKPMVADLKTGATVDFIGGSAAIQLAHYSRAETLYDAHTHSHTPMPDVDQDTGLIIHLPAGQARATLWFVDLAAGWEAAGHAHWVRGWRKRKDLLEPWQPTSRLDSVIERRAGIVERLETLRDLGALSRVAALWPPGCPTLKQSQTHTPDQLTAIAHILVKVEAEVGAPFGPLDASTANGHKET
ncbi:MAG: hypothetical protein ACRDYV_02140 [Acidimicrobiia bacterium]